MDKNLKKLISKYLDSTYELDISSLQDYTVLLKTEDTRVSIGVVYDDVRDMFNLHPYNCSQYFNEWINSVAVKLNNDTVDDLYDSYSDIRTTPPEKIKFK